MLLGSSKSNSFFTRNIHTTIFWDTYFFLGITQDVLSALGFKAGFLYPRKSSFVSWANECRFRAPEICVNRLISPFAMCLCLVPCQMCSSRSVNTFRIGDCKLAFQSWDKIPEGPSPGLGWCCHVPLVAFSWRAGGRTLCACLLCFLVSWSHRRSTPKKSNL